MSAPVPSAHPVQVALQRHDWTGAERLALTLIDDDAGQAEGHFLLGVALLEQRRLAEALAALQRAVDLAPRNAEYLAQWARALAIVHRLPEALTAADRALAAGEIDALTLDTIGVVYARANAHERAATAFRRAVERAPLRASFQFNLASALSFTGDLDGAEAAYEACIALDPRCWKAHTALARLRRQTPQHNHIQRLQALLPAAGNDADALLHLHHALAKEREDLGEYPQSFAHLVAGKRAKRETLGYAFSQDAELFDAIEQSFPLDLIRREGFDSDEPIFVVGLPRTGTTLVERILSSHSQVQSAGELQHFGHAFKRLGGSRTPQLLDRDTLQRGREIEPQALGERYLASTRPLTGARPRFVDKMPLNFLYAGWIAAALPRARIVCLRRHPMDACLSNFRQLFALNWSYYNYGYDLLDTGRYWLRFDRLIDFWQRHIPGRILELHYEQLIAEQEAQSRRLLEFCDLSWEPACLTFERNTAPVATASAAQVRQPLYADAVARWRRYEAQLQPLRELFEAHGVKV